MTCYALIPAAGGGSRMGAVCPKQYLPLAGKPLIWHTLKALCTVRRIERVCVVLSDDDHDWDRYDWNEFHDQLRVLRCGGATRAQSVTNGLRQLSGAVIGSDWILVHDAARCCLTPALVETLLDELENDPVGGLLAIPVADTLKRTQDDQRVAETVARAGLWQAQTPQMFRYGMLLDALENAPEVTDEAGAIEVLGMKPKLVTADATNFKVTWPLDLQLAEWILASRG